MVGTGSSNSRLVNGDNRAIGVSNEAVESRGVSSSIDGGGSSSSVDTSNNSLGGQMIGTGGSNSRLINRDNSAVGVSNQLGVEVEGAGIAVVDGGNGNGRSSGVGDRGDGGGSAVAEGRGVGVGLSLDSKMIGTGGGNSRLINGDNSTVGVSDQLCVEVEGAGIAVGGSVARVASIGNRGGIVAGVCNSRGSSNWGSGIASISNSGGSSIASIANSGGSSIASIANWGNSSLERQMVSTGSSHGGLINGDNSAIGEGLESIEALGGGSGNTSGENLEKRDIVGTCICPLIVLL